MIEIQINDPRLFSLFFPNPKQEARDGRYKEVLSSKKRVRLKIVKRRLLFILSLLLLSGTWFVCAAGDAALSERIASWIVVLLGCFTCYGLVESAYSGEISGTRVLTGVRPNRQRRWTDCTKDEWSYINQTGGDCG